MALEHGPMHLLPNIATEYVIPPMDPADRTAVAGDCSPNGSRVLGSLSQVSVKEATSPFAPPPFP